MTAIWKLYSSSNWSSATGKILQIETETIRHFDSNSSSSGRSFDYKVSLEYEYMVNGTHYTGSQLYPMLPNVFSSQHEADQYLKQFPLNSQVDVYYQPTNPNDSCLISTQLTFKQFLILSGLFIVIFSLLTAGIIFFNRLSS